ncbi:uncharacterized protein LOC135842414 [Planococcus citri]|uniref:uncharacterized protein LOC135842414 n=1 Tax=Planococcus citri TaxID=170843 RepID=UPI0031F9E9A3
MNNLVISSIFLYAAICCDATLWGSSETRETKPPGYLPILQVRKYNGFQINPVQGTPIYLPNEPSQTNNIEAQLTTNQPNQIKILQLDTISRLASYLPADFDLQDMDLSDILPYVDLISEDTLEQFKHDTETSKKPEKSKILKLIAFIKSIKEKKLKPFKYVASVGSNIIHKKKNWIFGSATTTTPAPSVTYPAPSSPYSYNPSLTQFGQYFPLTGARFPPLQSFPYYQQYPIYSYNQQQQKNPIDNTPSFPSADQFPSSYPVVNLPLQFQNTKPIETPAEPASLPKFPSSNPTPAAAIPEFQQIPNNNIQFPSNSFAYPSLPAAQNSEPAKTEVTYEYKQPPASTFVVHDTITNGANRQVVSFNQPELPSTASPAAPQAEHSSNQQLQYSYRISPASTVYSPPPRQQPSLLNVPAYQPNSWYIPSSYQNTHQEPNKFYTTSSSNDLVAAGSDDVEKIDQPVKPTTTSSRNEGETESAKLLDSAVQVLTSTETTFSKSQQSGPKRTHLRPVQVPIGTTPSVVYPSLPKEEIPKDDVNKSSPAINSSTTN